MFASPPESDIDFSIGFVKKMKNFLDKIENYTACITSPNINIKEI